MASWTLYLTVPSRMENDSKVPEFPSKIVVD